MSGEVCSNCSCAAIVSGAIALASGDGGLAVALFAVLLLVLELGASGTALPGAPFGS